MREILFKAKRIDDGLWIGEGVYNGGLSLLGHLFQFIKWEDEEPYSIKKLLGD